MRERTKIRWQRPLSIICRNSSLDKSMSTLFVYCDFLKNNGRNNLQLAVQYWARRSSKAWAHQLSHSSFQLHQCAESSTAKMLHPKLRDLREEPGGVCWGERCLTEQNRFQSLQNDCFLSCSIQVCAAIELNEQLISRIWHKWLEELLLLCSFSVLPAVTVGQLAAELTLKPEVVCGAAMGCLQRRNLPFFRPTMTLYSVYREVRN